MEIYQGDALEQLRKLPNGYANAFVTDPPYASGGFSEAAKAAATSQGISSNSEAANGWFAGDNIGTEGLCWLLREMAVEAHRVMTPDGSLLIFADWRMVPSLVPAIASAGYRYQNQVIWDKGSTGLGAGFRAQYEACLHFTKGRGLYYAQDASNLINAKRVKLAVRKHQTQKPVELIRELLRVVCPPGGRVVDPFGGSGTTAVAAMELGMHCVLIEREPKNINIAAERISEAALLQMGAA